MRRIVIGVGANKNKTAFLNLVSEISIFCQKTVPG